MKINFLVLFILISMISGGCNKSKEALVNTNNIITNKLNPLIGTWKLEKDTIISSGSGFLELNNFVSSIGKDTCLGNYSSNDLHYDSITFNKDSSITGGNPNLPLTGNWHLNNSTLIIYNLQTKNMLYGNIYHPDMTYWFYLISKSNQLVLKSPYIFISDECDINDGTIDKREIDFVKVK